MNAEEVKSFIERNFEQVKKDRPWRSDPEFTVFRHKNNRKWFALVFFAKKRQLLKLKPKDTKLKKEDDPEVRIDIINVKVDPEMISDLVKIPGILPAYHMNRRHWVSILLNGTVKEGTIAPLIDMSYEMTKKRSYIKERLSQ